EDAVLGADLADRLGDRRRRLVGQVAAAGHRAMFEQAAAGGDLLHLGDGELGPGHRLHGVGDEDLVQADVARGVQEREDLGQGDVAGFDYHFVLFGEGEDFQDLRLEAGLTPEDVGRLQDRKAAGGHVALAEVVLGRDGGQPDDLAADAAVDL